MSDLQTLLKQMRTVLDAHAFPSNNEAELQAMVLHVLEVALYDCVRELAAERGRYDVHVTHDGFAIVLELKVKGSAGAVERQAQRYALTEGVDAVVLVTTSNRLAAQLRAGTLGGKPFTVIALRTF